MKKLWSAALLFCLGALSSVNGSALALKSTDNLAKFTSAPGDTRTEYDARFSIRAYGLPDSTTALFDINSSTPSPWWSVWDSLSNSQIRLSPSANGGWYNVPWINEGDAQLTIRAAYCKNGLFLFFEATDDCWADMVSSNFYTNNPWAVDAADFYLDWALGKGAAEIYSHPNDHFIGPNKNELTFTGANYQCRFGGLDPVTSARIMRYDPRVLSPLPRYSLPMGVPQEGMDFAQLFNTYGIKVKILKLQDTGAKKVQEWFIPWDQIGQLGGTGGEMPQISSKIAFTAGYHDVDGVDTMYNSLCWRNDGDPYRRIWVDLNRDGKMSSDEWLPVHCWGDIIIDGFITPTSITREKISLMPLQSPVSNRRPQFAWHSVPGASSYTIIIGTDSSVHPPLAVVPLADTTYRPIADLPLGTIYWKVTANTGISSDISSFTIAVFPDSIPALIKFNGIATSTKRPVFKWHPVKNATGYRIEIADNTAFTGVSKISVPVSDTTFTPLANLGSGKQYWRVSCSRNFSLFSWYDSLVIPSASGTMSEKTQPTNLSPVTILSNGNRTISVHYYSEKSSFMQVQIYNLKGAKRAEAFFPVSAGSGRIVWSPVQGNTGISHETCVFRVILNSRIYQQTVSGIN